MVYSFEFVESANTAKNNKNNYDDEEDEGFPFQLKIGEIQMNTQDKEKLDEIFRLRKEKERKVQ